MFNDLISQHIVRRKYFQIITRFVPVICLIKLSIIIACSLVGADVVVAAPGPVLLIASLKDAIQNKTTASDNGKI